MLVALHLLQMSPPDGPDKTEQDTPLWHQTHHNVDLMSPFVIVQVSAPDGQGRVTPLRALHADLLALSQEEREQAGSNLVVATAPDDLLRAGAQPEDSWMIRMLVRGVGRLDRPASLVPPAWLLLRLLGA